MRLNAFAKAEGSCSPDRTKLLHSSSIVNLEDIHMTQSTLLKLLTVLAILLAGCYQTDVAVSEPDNTTQTNDQFDGTSADPKQEAKLNEQLAIAKSPSGEASQHSSSSTNADWLTDIDTSFDRAQELATKSDKDVLLVFNGSGG